MDAYLLVPPNFESPDAVFEFRSRKSGDFVSSGSFTDAVNDAVRSQRLADANISEAQLREIDKDVNLDEKGLNEKGEEKDSSGTFAAAFVIGLMIYITLAIYGQAIMAAVVEEKETRIAEILFSSARPFELMLGKLVGVGLAGLTQLMIWVISATVLASIAARAAGRSRNGCDIAADHAAYVRVFLYFLPARIFYLCLDLCADRIDGHNGAGRRAVRISADHDIARRVLS